MKQIIGSILLAASALVIQFTVKPGTALTIVLVAIVVLCGLALLAIALWESPRFWSRVAAQLAPHLPAARASVSADDELRAAIDDVNDELLTIDHRLGEVIGSDYYAHDFYLPGQAYEDHKAAISARSHEAREALGDVYVTADQVNRAVQRFEDGCRPEDIQNVHDPLGLANKTERARELLDKIRP